MPDKKTRGVSNLANRIPDVPDAPTVSAVDVGTSRAYNDGAATVTITPTTGGLPSSYSITTTPTTTTTTATSSPVTITGLSSATSYTATVTPSNISATGASATTSSFTATTVPQAPTIGTFTDGGTGTSGTLSFTAGATGGSSITNYSYSTDSSTYTTLSPAQTSSPLNLSGLTAGTYTFSVKAINANGTSSASGGVSGTVITPSSYESIATVTVGSGGAANVEFTSIPATYTHLQIKGIARTDRPDGNQDALKIRYNSDTGNNYAIHYLLGNGSSASAGGTASSSGNFADGITNSVSAANCFGAFIVDILDYTNTNKYKTVKALSGREDNSEGAIWFESGLWMNTNAISGITIIPNTGPNFAQYSHFALYGIKGA